MKTIQKLMSLLIISFLLIPLDLYSQYEYCKYTNPCPSVGDLSAYTLSGGHISQTHLKYFIGGNSKVSYDVLKTGFLMAFNTWSNEVPFTCEEVFNEADAFLKILPVDHDTYCSVYDYEATTLAASYVPGLPCNGTILLNADLYDFVLDPNAIPRPINPRDIVYVLTHELGHTFGLCHSNKTSSVMYKEENPIRNLSQDDINGIHAIYNAIVTVQNKFENPDKTFSVGGGIVSVDDHDYLTDNLTNKEQKFPFVSGETHKFEAKDQNYNEILRKFNANISFGGGWYNNDGMRLGIAPVLNIQVTPGKYTSTYRSKVNVNMIAQTEFDGNTNISTGSQDLYQYDPFTFNFPSTKTIGARTYDYIGMDKFDKVVLNNDETFTPTGNGSVTSIYKLINNSNNQDAIKNNGQRKLVHIYGGWSHKIYESMNKIWMESSTDNGKTWTFAPYNPISGTTAAHSPSIDIPDGPYPYEYIVYYTNDAASGTNKVMLTINYDNTFRNTIDVSNGLPFSNYDFQPVISIKQNEANSKIIAIWRQPYMDYFDPAGLYYRVGTINLDHTVTWNDCPRVIVYTENCSNPAIVASKTLTDPNQFHLAYQEDLGDGDSRVSYLRLDLNSDNTISLSNGYEVSQGSGYYVNTNPSITLFGGLPKVSWIGYDRVVTYMQDALFRSKDGSFSWGSVHTYDASGNNTVSVSLDKVGTSGYLLGYGDEYGDIRYVKSTSLSTVRFADNSGSYVQVKGGPDFNNSFITGFHNESLPYYFTSSNAISVLGKTNTETVSGRGLNITEDGMGYSFNLKDVRLDGSQVDFTEESDSVSAQRNFIETQAFSVGDNSELTYSYSYFTSDSAKVLMSLKDGEVVNYSLDLVDATSSEILKNLASVSYSNKDVNKKRPEYYKLLLKGIGNRTVKLRISSDVSLTDASGVVSTIAKIYSTGSSLKKNGFIEVNYSDVKPVVEYGLSQNYPNPFNPSTVINYQIPKASKVTLKIYDMLGKEVTTLVNEYKEMGRYSVEFNASELPSGTYIYEIRANDFIKSGKMMLLK
ncbi:MAG TPA: matrixin family metalloprotease [Ignavibacteriales bacterium]|nr:matrixin family metalloprotease [Ignavibacteriales bacterium]